MKTKELYDSVLEKNASALDKLVAERIMGWYQEDNEWMTNGPDPFAHYRVCLPKNKEWCDYTLEDMEVWHPTICLNQIREIENVVKLNADKWCHYDGLLMEVPSVFGNEPRRPAATVANLEASEKLLLLLLATLGESELSSELLRIQKG